MECIKPDNNLSAISWVQWCVQKNDLHPACTHTLQEGKKQDYNRARRQTRARRRQTILTNRNYTTCPTYDSLMVGLASIWAINLPFAWRGRRSEKKNTAPSVKRSVENSGYPSPSLSRIETRHHTSHICRGTHV